MFGFSAEYDSKEGKKKGKDEKRGRRLVVNFENREKSPRKKIDIETSSDSEFSRRNFFLLHPLLQLRSRVVPAGLLQQSCRPKYTGRRDKRD